MAALGQQTQRFVVFELAQAHGALDRCCCYFHGSEIFGLEGREGLDHGRVEATVTRPVRGNDWTGACVHAIVEEDAKESHEEESPHEEHDDQRRGMVKIHGDGRSEC